MGKKATLKKPTQDHMAKLLNTSRQQVGRWVADKTIKTRLEAIGFDPYCRPIPAVPMVIGPAPKIPPKVQLSFAPDPEPVAGEQEKTVALNPDKSHKTVSVEMLTKIVNGYRDDQTFINNQIAALKKHIAGCQEAGKKVKLNEYQKEIFTYMVKNCMQKSSIISNAILRRYVK